MRMATNSDKNFYKIIIVGAGPAGISAALHLREGGVSDVLVVERYAFPRYKCCAGYVTGKTKKAYERLGLRLDDCHYSLIRDFRILYKNIPRLRVENKFLYTNRSIDRVELDSAFCRLAKEKGVSLLENTKISAHEPENSRVILSDGKVLDYGALIFADGTTGFGSRYQSGKKRNIALQLTFPDDRPEAIDIHFGITKRGYGWVSSYGGVTNVGLTDVVRPGVNYREAFAAYMDKLGIAHDISDLKAAFTPIGTGKPLLFGNVYFVGDAVGACDPFTLSGLRYALSSGEYCARAIVQENAKIYGRFVRRLKAQFLFMKAISKLFYLKAVLCLLFNVGCRLFGKAVGFVFNHFFINKK